MSEEKTIEELVAMIQAGELDMLPVLWGRVERFVKMYVNRVCKLCGGTYYGLTFDDLYDTGYIGMCNAVDHFKPEREGKFLTLLPWYLRAAFSQAAGVHSRKQCNDPLFHCVSLDTPLGADEDADTLGDTVEDAGSAAALESVEARIYQGQLHNMLEELMQDALTPFQREIIRARFYNNLSQKEIAERAGKAPQYVQASEGKALRNMRAPKYMQRLEQFIEGNTNYYLHVGIEQFNSTHTSAVEEIVFRRDEQERKALERERETKEQEFEKHLADMDREIQQYLDEHPSAREKLNKARAQQAAARLWPDDDCSA